MNNIYTLEQIETPRLIIRPVQLGDEIELNQAITRSLKSLQRWMPWAKDPSLEATREFARHGSWCWTSKKGNDFPMVAIHKSDKRIIAATGFNEHSVPVKPFYEIGYWVDAEYQGQGLVTELVNALTRYALNALSAHRVQICTQIDNERSIAVAKRSGFIYEATRKNDHLDYESGQPTDGYIFSCCHTSSLPPLEVTWLHKNPNDSIAIVAISPTVQTRLQPTVTLSSLETKRLKLIPPREQDTQASFDALRASVAEVAPWFSWALNSTLDQHHYHIKESAAAAIDIHSHYHLSFYVWDLKQDRLLGEVWYKVHDWTLPYVVISYWFDTRFTGHGYATEAIAEMVKYAFTHLKAKRVELNISEQNLKSLRLAKRLGFVFEGKLKNHCRNFVTNEVMASELFSMTDLAQLTTH